MCEKTVVIKKPSRFPRPPAAAASQAKAITSYATASYVRKNGGDQETQPIRPGPRPPALAPAPGPRPPQPASQAKAITSYATASYVLKSGDDHENPAGPPRRPAPADNPALARDLKIGRPDLPRSYDGGGLVDVNHVPAEALVGCLSLTPQQAEAVIAARGQPGRFSSPEEMSAYANLPPACLDTVGDLIIFG